jgi:excisionase family DNA binding protein
MNEWMTVKEASIQLGISESYIRSHIKKGCLNCDIQGYLIRLASTEIDIFVLPYEHN